MKEFDYNSSVVDTEDLLDGGDFISSFAVSLSEHKNRLTATAAETSAARTIRNRLAEETGAKVRLEAYKAHPQLGRSAFPFAGIWYAFSLVLYFISFAGGRAAGLFLTALALAVFMTGMGVVVSLFFGGKAFRWLLAPRVSYNVVSEQNAKLVRRGKERIVVIADNHDAMAGSYSSEGALKRLVYIIAPVSAFLFVVFCVLKMALGVDNPAKISVLTVLPAIVGIVGVFVMLIQFSPFERHAKQNNGIATSIAMATYGYFVEYPELVPDDVKIVYVSLGGENSGRGGSEAFINAHPELRKDTKALAIGDITGEVFQVAECDAVRRIPFSTQIVSLIRSSAHEQGIEIETVKHDTLKEKTESVFGYISNNFASNGIASATVLAVPKDKIVRAELDRSDVEKMFALCVGTVLKFFKESKNGQSGEVTADTTETDGSDNNRQGEIAKSAAQTDGGGGENSATAGLSVSVDSQAAPAPSSRQGVFKGRAAKHKNKDVTFKDINVK